jgi:uncharacterized membrane protein
MAETWIIFSLIFAFTHAIGSILDKIIIRRDSIDPMSFSTFKSGTNAILALIASLFFSFTILGIVRCPRERLASSFK